MRPAVDDWYMKQLPRVGVLLFWNTVYILKTENFPYPTHLLGVLTESGMLPHSVKSVISPLVVVIFTRATLC